MHWAFSNQTGRTFACFVTDSNKVSVVVVVVVIFVGVAVVCLLFVCSLVDETKGT